MNTNQEANESMWLCMPDNVYVNVRRSVYDAANSFVHRNVGHSVWLDVTWAVIRALYGAVIRALNWNVWGAVWRAVRGSREPERELCRSLGGSAIETNVDAKWAVNRGIGKDSNVDWSVLLAVDWNYSGDGDEVVANDVPFAVERAVNWAVGEVVERAVSRAVDRDAGREVSR